MTLAHAAWVAAQRARWARAELVLAGQEPLHALLSGWPIPLDERRAQALVRLQDPPETEEMARLVAWAAGEQEDDGAPRTLLAWDARALARPAACSPERRRLAALCLLARLGDELRTREHEAPAAKRWEPGPLDAEHRAAWSALLTGRELLGAARALARRLRGVVRASFAGVATTLRLPPEMARQLGAQADEQLDLVLSLAAGELGAWVLETAGEPIGALCAALGPEPRRKVLACTQTRDLWLEVREILGVDEASPDLAAGTAAAILRRLSSTLSEGRAAAHELGPPGWGVVVANRARVRGRLRAAAGADPPTVERTLRDLPALAARSAAAIGRFAWGWAWREARTGFGLDLDRAAAPRCEVGAPLRGRPPPLGPEELPALRTLALLIAGRGHWEDLERWVEGEGGRASSRGFYRCLEAAPDALTDPASPGQRARGYERLRAWLFEGGLELLLPVLSAAGAAVAPLGPGRDLRARMREALSPWWDDSAISFPQHHLPGFREGLCATLSRPPSRRAGPPAP